MLEQVLERIAAALEKQNEMAREIHELRLSLSNQPCCGGTQASEVQTAVAHVVEDKPKRTRRTKAEIEAAEKAQAEATPKVEEPQQEVAVEPQNPSLTEDASSSAEAASTATAQVSSTILKATESDAAAAEPAPTTKESDSAHNNSEPEAPSVTWAQALEAIKQVNASDKPSGGRNGVIKVMVEFGVIPKEVDHTKDGRVPELEKTGKFAEIKAFAESLLKQEDLGL